MKRQIVRPHWRKHGRVEVLGYPLRLEFSIEGFVYKLTKEINRCTDLCKEGWVVCERETGFAIAGGHDYNYGTRKEAIDAANERLSKAGLKEYQTVKRQILKRIAHGTDV